MALKCFVSVLAVASLVTVATGWESKRPPQGEAKNEKTMYGLIGKMTTIPGKRDELINILLEGVHEMPGCLSYVVSKDTTDPDAIWISEVWDSQASYKASLSLPAVRKSMTRGKPLIAGFGQRVVTEPVGGHGLTKAK